MAESQKHYAKEVRHREYMFYDSFYIKCLEIQKIIKRLHSEI